jgi:GNAT superfamily N-acetyltransferase
MKVHLATTDNEIAACFHVMHELRPAIVEESFVAKVRELEHHGYQLAYIAESGNTVAVAGFRLGESLAWGRYLYVEDLVTQASQRSRGFGAALLRWLGEYAEQHGCGQLHLDSGVQRKDAHRFYEREGMTRASYHFYRLIENRYTSRGKKRP